MYKRQLLELSVTNVLVRVSTRFHRKKVLHNKPLRSVRQVDRVIWQAYTSGCCLLKLFEGFWFCATPSYASRVKILRDWIKFVSMDQGLLAWQTPKGGCKWCLLRLDACNQQCSSGECPWTSAFCHFHQRLTWHCQQFVPDVCRWHESFLLKLRRKV